MRLSDDRINSIAHKAANALPKAPFLTLKAMSNSLRLAIKQAFEEAFDEEGRLEAVVRERISHRKGLEEGSREWDSVLREEMIDEIRKRAR